MAPLNKFDVFVDVDDNDYTDTHNDNDRHYIDLIFHDGGRHNNQSIVVILLTNTHINPRSKHRPDRIQFQTTVRSSQTKIGLAFFTT